MTNSSRSIARVCLFCGANVGARAAYATAARAFGRQLAQRGVALVYGGGSVGLMNETANAVLAEGGSVIGVITEALMAREVGHAGLSELIVVDSMHARKKRMADLADAFLTLPGGYGTFDEICEMLTWNQLGIHEKPVVLVNLEGFFDGFLAQLDRAVADRLLTPANRAMLCVVDAVESALDAARDWRPPPAGAKWYRDPIPEP
ncbi:MAG TPA: TIGR00730 family Rossman fold protein [Casimicrobiaceae bacterium]|nr:TIGR00730 family Rossman fold protein [Casimicrobiaceae bacterium]